MRCLPAASVAVAAVLLLIAPAHPTAQADVSPFATSVDALVRDPAFFDGRGVTVAGAPVADAGRWWFVAPASAGPAGLGAKRVLIVPDRGQPDARPLELNGTVRVSGGNVELVGATWVDDVARAQSIREIVLHASRWAGKTVTLRGQFRARNLAPDLPDRLTNTPSDFVLRLGSAAIWVAGLQPRGRGFDLDPTSVRDFGRWLDVTGIVRVQNGETRLDGTAIALAPLPPASVPLAPPASSPTGYRLPRPKVVFTTPVNRQIDVEPDATVRIQFSRDMREATLVDQVQVVYDGGSPDTPPPFTLMYRVRNRSLTLKFTSPLAPGSNVVVRLGPGMAAMDGSLADPVEFSFRVGGG